ncbi:hypothetical protein KCU91_g143, partial [Aureobasidium melanogenum]
MFSMPDLVYKKATRPKDDRNLGRVARDQREWTRRWAGGMLIVCICSIVSASSSFELHRLRVSRAIYTVVLLYEGPLSLKVCWDVMTFSASEDDGY